MSPELWTTVVEISEIRPYVFCSTVYKTDAVDGRNAGNDTL